MSLDGFIATEDDSLDWLSMVEEEGEDYGYADFTKDIDTYIVGRKTYEIVKGLCGGTFPQASQYKCFVITRQKLEPKKGVTFYNGDIKDLIQNLKSQEGANIYCDGGGQIVQLLMAENLIDEYIISIIPIALGNGKRLFLGDHEEIQLKALPTKQFKFGLVQVRYERES